MARKEGKALIRISYEKIVGTFPVEDSEITESEYIFKKNIRALRERAGLTQIQFAEAINVNESYYSKLERLTEHVSPPFEWYDVIAKVYGIEPYHLFVDNIMEYIENP